MEKFNNQISLKGKVIGRLTTVFVGMTPANAEEIVRIVTEKQKTSSGAVVASKINKCLIATSVHGIHGSYGEGEISVFQDGKKYTAKVLEKWPMKDVAIMEVYGDDGEKIKNCGVPFKVQVGFNDGQEVVAHGYANKKKKGKASYRSDGLPMMGNVIIDYGTTANRVKKGMSGGPVVTKNGKMVGLNAAYRPGTAEGTASSLEELDEWLKNHKKK